MGLMDPSSVIKINYGDSLRRITLDPDEKGNFGLNVDRLRARIISLFKLDTDADLTLTYIDEDDEIITLVDEADLYDALQQPLNPLRITVKLNSCMPQFQQHTMSDIKPSVTEPLHVTELVECLSKLALTQMGPISQRQANASFNTQSSTSEIDDVKVKQDLETSKDTISTPQVFPSDEFIVLDRENNHRGLENESTNKDVETSFPSKIAPFNPSLNMFPTEFGNIWGSYSRTPRSTDYWKKQLCGTFSDSDCKSEIPSIAGNYSTSQNGFGPQHTCPTTANYPTAFPSKIAPFNPSLIMFPTEFGNIWGSCSRTPRSTDYWKKQLCGTFADSDCKNEIPSIAGNYSTSQNGFGPEHTCPTIAKNEMHGSDIMSLSGNHVTTHCKANCHIDSSRGGIESHLGIQCDRSKVCSIIGPQLKLNYDHNQLPRPLGQLNQKDSGLKPCTRMLDSLFIQDRQVKDGTFMKPGNSFTKIWRMRNNGTMVWPPEIQLIWVGGSQFTEKASVEIQVPPFGLYVDDELDIEVDFTAPDQPGRYTSCWRMALPSGHKFGQVIWVDIQVDTSPEDPSSDRFHQLRSNGGKEKSKEEKNVEVQVQSLDDSLAKSDPYFDMGTEIIKLLFDDDQSRNKQKLHSSSITKEVAGPGNFNITTGLAKQIVHDQPNHNQKLNSYSSTNVSKSFEQHEASKVSKLNQSKKLEEKRFEEFYTENKKYNQKVCGWFEAIEELELKGFIDVDNVAYKFMDRQDRKKRSGKKNKYKWK